MPLATRVQARYRPRHDQHHAVRAPRFRAHHTSYHRRSLRASLSGGKAGRLRGNSSPLPAMSCPRLQVRRAGASPARAMCPSRLNAKGFAGFRSGRSARAIWLRVASAQTGKTGLIQNRSNAGTECLVRTICPWGLAFCAAPGGQATQGLRAKAESPRDERKAKAPLGRKAERTARRGAGERSLVSYKSPSRRWSCSRRPRRVGSCNRQVSTTDPANPERARGQSW